MPNSTRPTTGAWFTCYGCETQYWSGTGYRWSKGLCGTCKRDDDKAGHTEYPTLTYYKAGAHHVTTWLLTYHPRHLADALSTLPSFLIPDDSTLVQRIDALGVGKGNDSVYGACLICDCDVDPDAQYLRRLCKRCYHREYRAGRRGGYDGLIDYPAEDYWKHPDRYAWYVILDAGNDIHSIVEHALGEHTTLPSPTAP